MPQLSRLKQNLHQLFFSPNLWLVATWGFVLLGVVSRLFVYLDCQNLWLDEAFLAKSIYHTPLWAGSLLPLIQKSKHNRVFAILQNNDWQYIEEIKDFYPKAIHLDSGFSLFIIDKACTSPALLGR